MADSNSLNSSNSDSKDESQITQIASKAVAAGKKMFSILRGNKSTPQNPKPPKSNDMKGLTFSSPLPQNTPIPEHASTAIHDPSKMLFNNKNSESSRNESYDDDLYGTSRNSDSIVEVSQADVASPQSKGEATLFTDALQKEIDQAVELARAKLEVSQANQQPEQFPTAKNIIDQHKKLTDMKLQIQENAFIQQSRELHDALLLESERLKNERIELARQKVEMENRILQAESASDEKVKSLQEQMNSVLASLVSAQNSNMNSPSPTLSSSASPLMYPYSQSNSISSSIPTIVTTSITNSISSIASTSSRTIYPNSISSPQSSGFSIDTSHQIINLLQKIIDNQQTSVKPTATPVPPKSNFNNIEESIRHLAPGGIYQSTKPSPITNQSSLNQDLSQFLSSRLPTIDIEKFLGERNKYDAFKVKFQTLIASTNASLEEKAKTLYQALGNEVIMQLDHVPNLTDPEAYEKLWQSLDIEFGKFQHGHTGYVTELTTKLQNWPAVRTSAEVHQLYKLLKSYYTSLEQIGQEHEMEHSSIRMLILGRLTGKLLGLSSSLINHNPYAPVIKRILEYLKSHERDLSLEEMAKYRNPKSPSNSRSNYLNLQEEEARLAENINAVQSRNPRSDSRGVRFDERSMYRSPPPRPGSHGSDRGSPNSRSWQGNNQNGNQRHFDPGFQLEREQRFSKKCIFCCSDDHESDTCTRLSNPQEYRDILYKFRLCFNCHHQNHTNYNCILPKRCTKCNDSNKHSNVVCSNTQ